MENKNENYKYRWIMLFCNLWVSFLTWGVTYSVGIYYMRWIDYFGTSNADTAIVGSLSTGVGCTLGPLFGIIIHHIGFRKAGLIGATMVAFSHVASAFAPNLIVLGITYGFLAGMGVGLCHLSASVALNCYFYKDRALAEGVMAMGVGIGNFATSLFTQYLINIYDWRGTMLIMGGVTAHLIILCQIMIPPSELQKFPKLREWKSKKMEQKMNEEEEIEDNAEPNVLDVSYSNLQNIDYEIKLSLEDINYKDTERESRKTWLSQCLVLFRNPVFLLLLTADFICWVCLYVPYVHLAQRSRLQGLNVETTAWIQSTIGIAGIFGRPILSAIPTKLNIQVFYFYGCCNTLVGLITIISPKFSSTAGLFVYAAAFGFLSVCTPLGKASAASLLGNELFPSAYSWMLFFEGIGICVGPPIAGWIYDITQSYDYSFYYMGAGMVMSGLLVCLQNSSLRLEKQLKKRRQGSLVTENKLCD